MNKYGLLELEYYESYRNVWFTLDNCKNPQQESLTRFNELCFQMTRFDPMTYRSYIKPRNFCRVKVLDFFQYAKQNGVVKEKRNSSVLLKEEDFEDKYKKCYGVLGYDEQAIWQHLNADSLTLFQNYIKKAKSYETISCCLQRVKILNRFVNKSTF